MKKFLSLLFIIFSIHFFISYSLANISSSSLHKEKGQLKTHSCKEIFSSKSDALLENFDDKLLNAIEASSLEIEHINLIIENSAGILLFNDFLENHPIPTNSPAIVLGTSHPTPKISQKIYFSLYHAILLVKKQIPHWHSVYQWLGLHPTQSTSNQFMEELLKKNRPIYFIVPDQILIDFKPTSYTRQEIEWLLNHPQKLKQVYFVFGATQIKSDDEWKSWFETYPVTSRDESDLSVVRLAWSWYQNGLIDANDIHPGLSQGQFTPTTRYFSDGTCQYTRPSSW